MLSKNSDDLRSFIFYEDFNCCQRTTLRMVLATLALTVCTVWFQLKARDVAGQALSFIQDLVAALLNFHTYTEQRVHIYPRDSSIETISPLNQRVRRRHMFRTSTGGRYRCFGFFLKCYVCDTPVLSVSIVFPVST